MEEMAASVHSGGLSSETWQEQSSNPVCQCQWKMVVRQVRGRPCGNIKRSRLHPHLGHSEAVYGLCGAHRSASFSSQSLSPSHTDLNLTIFRPSPPKMFSLLLTGLLATTVALASDDSSGATKTVLVSAPGLLRPPVLQGSRFVVSSGGQRPTVVDTPTVALTAYQQQQQQEQSSPVRAATTGSSSEGKAVPAYQSEVPQQEQSAGLSAQAFYSSSYPQHYDYSHRRYVPSSYVYSPPYLYPSSGGAVQHPFLQGQQSPVIELDALSASVQILVRTPTGLQVFRPVPLSRPPVHYFVGVFPTVSEQQQQGSKQPPAAQEQSLLTKVEVPVSSEVANETQSSGDTSPAAAAAVSLASSATVTEVVPSGGQSTGEAKAESSGTSDSF